MRRARRWAGRRWALAGALSVLLALVAVAQPAGAASDAERYAAYDEALVLLTQEVGWLVRLGGLAEPVPADIASIPDAIGLPVLSRDAMIEWLRVVDTDGPRAWQNLLATGDPQSIAVRDTFRLLPPGTLETLEAGGNPGIPADGYNVAYGQLIDQWWPLHQSGAGSSPPDTTVPPSDTVPPMDAVPPPSAPQDTVPPTIAPPGTVTPSGGAGPATTAAPLAGGGPVPTAGGTPSLGTSGPTARPSGAPRVTAAGGGGAAPATTAAPTTSVATTVGATTDGAGVTAARTADRTTAADGSAPPLALLAAGVGLLVLTAVVAAVVSRRRRSAPAVAASSPAGPSVSAPDASSETASGIGTAELFELSRVLPTLRTPEAVAAHVVDAVVALVDRDASAAVVDTALNPLAGALPLGGSVLRPVFESGRSLRTSVGDQAFAAVALVTAGRVIGAVVVSRTGPPFPATVEDRLGDVATVAASSLQASFDHREAERLAYVDALTQVANRRRFDLDLADALRVAHNGVAPVALAMVDIDHFKSLNDEHGHQTGDEVLRHVAGTIAANVRTGDVVYRYGGEEFAVLLPGADDVGAAEVVERVRAAVQSASVTTTQGTVLSVTVSVGVARSVADEPADLLAAADGALYAAKGGGRNRVVVAERSL